MSHPRRPSILLFLLSLALAAPAAAAAPKVLKVRFPRTVVEPGRNVERCVFVRLPVDETFDLGGWEVMQHGAGGTSVGIAHFLVYLYTGQRAGEFSSGQVVDSRACLDLGPADRDQRQLLASSSGPRSTGALPPGLAQPLAPTPARPGGPPDAIGILLDANWVNNSTRGRAVSARVVLRRAAPGTVRRRLAPILARDAEAEIFVPPFGTAASRGIWHPPGDVCLYDVTGKTHRRGRFFGVQALDAAGQPRAPLDGLRNVFTGGPSLFGSLDYTDPGVRRFAPRGLPLGAGESLGYECWHENGDRLPLRLGCEASPGETPGALGTPAPACAADCTCVPANVVAGTTPDDEVCGLAGWYYDAAPGGSCDVTGLPAVESGTP